MKKGGKPEVGPGSEDAMPPLGEVLDFMRMLWSIDHGLQTTSKRMEATLGVTGLQRMVLRLVGRFPGISAGHLARILHVHVSDAKPMPPEEVLDNMRHFPGEGIIDLVGFFQALKAIGYRGGIAPETIGPRVPDGMPPEESAKLALEATTAVLKRAGVV